MNPAIRNAFFRFIVVLGAAWLASGCDYPEQGFYTLIAFDGYAMPLESWPLMIDELVDDTGMTYGFNVLRPVGGELVEFSLVDASDETRRAWRVALTDETCSAGELDLLISHSAELLSFSGAYQPVPGVEAPVYPVAGFVRSSVDGRTGSVYINGDLPPLPLPLAQSCSFELRTLSREEFEGVLGVSIDTAVRRPALARDELAINAEIPETVEPIPVTDIPEETVEPGAEDPPAKPPEKQKSPPLGGRRGTRPR